MSKHLSRWMILLSLATLCGCARNTLLREEAHDFAEGAATAALGSRAFYDSAIATDRELRIALLTLDSDCVPAELRPDPGGPACTIAGETVELRGALTRDSFSREYAHLDFLASYLAALAELTADIESHSGENFKAAKADLDTLLAIVGNDAPLSDDAAGAVSELLDFVNTLSKEHASAKEIRAVLRSKGDRAHQGLTALAKALLQDAQLREAGEAAVHRITEVSVQQGLLGDATARAQTLQSWYARDDRRHAAAVLAQHCKDTTADADARRFCGAPAAGLMAAAAATHRELLDLEEGKLNARQKARQARIVYGRFMQAAKLFVKLVAVF